MSYDTSLVATGPHRDMPHNYKLLSQIRCSLTAEASVQCIIARRSTIRCALLTKLELKAHMREIRSVADHHMGHQGVKAPASRYWSQIEPHAIADQNLFLPPSCSRSVVVSLTPTLQSRILAGMSDPRRSHSDWSCSWESEVWASPSGRGFCPISRSVRREASGRSLLRPCFVTLFGLESFVLVFQDRERLSNSSYPLC